MGVEIVKEAWDKLVISYATTSKLKIRELMMQIYSLKHGADSIKNYVQRAKEIANKLVALQHFVLDDDLVEFIKAGLEPTYRPFT